MRPLLLIFAAFLSLSPFSYGQNTLVYFNELTFNSAFEKQALAKFIQEDNKNYLEVFMAIEPGINSSKFDNAFSEYRTKFKGIYTDKVKSKRSDKKLKFIYEQIHSQFLTQYKERILFNSIFENGQYNCVSASALYGIALEEANIPYIIKERPTHVYVLAYPNNEQIVVEATDPAGGYLKFNSKYKQAFVDRMAKAKLISDAEVTSKSTDLLFDEYYFTDTDITLTQLIGIQYLNDAIYRADNKDVEGAYLQMEKAWMFYKGQKINTLMLAFLIELINEQKYEELKFVGYLQKLARYKEYDIDTEVIKREFGRIINTHLIEKGDSKSLELFYVKLTDGLNDPSLIAEISYLYNYEQGRALYNQGKFKDALSFFEQAYLVKSSNLDINNILVTTLIKTMQNISNTEAVEILENVKSKHSLLIGNNLFKSALVNTYLVEMGNSFELSDEKKGLKYKELYEQYYDPELTVDKNNIGRAYSLAGVYYFRKNNKTRALKILNEGLNMAPHSHELLVRKRMILN